jgi:hypothetical protein
MYGSHKNLIPSYATLPKTKPTKKYRQIIDYCEKSLSRYKSGTLNGLRLKKMAKNYTEKNYFRVIDDFVRQRGFDTPESYIDYYYGDFLRKKTFKLKRRKPPPTNNNQQQFHSLPPPPYSSGNFKSETVANESKFNSLLYADSFKNYDFVQEGNTIKKNKTSSTSCTHFGRQIFQPVDEYGNDIDASDDNVTVVPPMIDVPKFCFRSNHVYLDDFILHGRRQQKQKQQPKELPNDGIYETIRSINPNYAHKSLPNFKINGECGNKRDVVNNNGNKTPGNAANNISGVGYVYLFFARVAS